jgi:hypothetical protein
VIDAFGAAGACLRALARSSERAADDDLGKYPFT